MSNQLDKPLIGQYRFLLEADRLATLVNLGVNDSATSATSTAIADAASVAVNWATGNAFSITPAGATTVSFSNLSAKRITLLVTGGAASVITWPTVTWNRGLAPADPSVGERFLVQFIYDGANVYGTVLTRSTQAGFDEGRGVASTVTATSTTNLNWNASNVFTVSISANVTFTFSNTSEKQIDVFVPVSGTRTVTWPTVKWNAGAAPAAPADTKTGWYRFRKVGAIFYGEAVSVNLS